MCGGPGHGPQGRLDDRLRARAQPGARRSTTRTRSSSAALATLGPQPPNFRNIVAVNRGPLLQDGAEAHPLAPRQLERRRAEGALLVDVRTELQFDDAHIPGSVCITALRAGFGTKLAWLADPEQDVLFVGRDDEDGRARRALAGRGRRDAHRRLPARRHDARGARRSGAGVRTRARDGARAARALAAGPGVQLLDVRERSEWDAGHIPGSRPRALPRPATRCPDGIDPRAPLAVICASGQRAAVGREPRAAARRADVWHVVDGGVGTWERSGFELERPA